MDLLGRYYTEEIFSKLLIDNVNYTSPSLIIDLGIGRGSLSSAAHQKWSNALYYGFDVDSKVVEYICKELPFVNIHLVDSLKSRFIEDTKISVGSVDIAVCNPPYLKVKQDSKYAEIFELTNLHPCIKLKSLTADLIFLAQNLKLLKEDGVLGIILPDSLLTSHDFAKFRNSLILNYHIEKIIQLPDCIFRKTEARTHILIIRNRKPVTNVIMLYKANFNGECSIPLIVSRDELVNRMDYDFHYRKGELILPNHELILGDVVEELKRGNRSGKELRESSYPHLHLKDITRKYLYLKNHKYPTASNYTIAKKGDIIITRVGKRSFGKVAKIIRGRIAVSDCLYVLRPKKGFATLIWENLNSTFSKTWLQVHAHGVCSQVISKADLVNLPLRRK